METSACKDIKKQIESRSSWLKKGQEELEVLLNTGTGSIDDVKKIGDLRKLIEDFNKELLQLKADQRKLGCISGESIELSQDNQTVISTSSVRKKDPAALVGLVR